MKTLYTNPTYLAHLHSRKLKQNIMLGFSDGTKDGGYLMANWAIYKAKQMLTSISRKYKVDVIFFDGRGGPPARGGGKTHKFYASLGPSIESKEVQLTVQGQTISSNFGTLDSSKYNVEQLMSSGILNKLNETDLTIPEDCFETMDHISKISYDAYVNFKNHPKFLPYLEHMSTLKYYSKTNVGSRPSKRNSDDKLIFSDLRAIPFVGSWSQLKQNVPGFFGVGYALKHYDDPQCESLEDFQEDLRRFRYLKRLLHRYHTNGEMRERLMLNHIICIFNVFGYDACMRMLQFKIKDDQYWASIKTTMPPTLIKI
jgi:phosphoenolpyruvate carboxylase